MIRLYITLLCYIHLYIARKWALLCKKICFTFHAIYIVGTQKFYAVTLFSKYTSISR